MIGGRQDCEGGATRFVYFRVAGGKNDAALFIAELSTNAVGTRVGAGALLFRAIEKSGHGKTLTKLKFTSLTSLKEKRLIKEILPIISKRRGK